MMIEPCESTFNDPATRQYDEAFLFIRAQDDTETNMASLSDPVSQVWPAITAIYPDESHFLACAGESPENQFGAIAFLDTSSRDDHWHEQAQRVNE